MKRKQLATIASQTLTAIEQGFYTNRLNECVDLADLIRTSVAATRLVTPEQWPGVEEQAASLPQNAAACPITVTDETTLRAAERLTMEEGRQDVCALNYASAKNPGGGFKGGSRAQEESLARSSGLYPTLTHCDAYYTANRQCKSLLYTDHAIFSKTVPVFKNDEGQDLDRPYMLSLITMPAANLGAMKPESPERERVGEVMRKRARWVLALAAISGQRNLILGAWGCGVFRNDPCQIAQAFAEALAPGDGFRRLFESIVFAVFDHTEDRHIHHAFETSLNGV